MQLLNRKGQTTAEYAIVIGVVVAAVVGMQLYVRRGIQAKLKGGTDYLATQATALGTMQQYDPYYTAAGTYTTETDNKAYTEQMQAGGLVSKTGIDDTTKRTGNATQGVNLSDDDAWK